MKLVGLFLLAAAGGWSQPFLIGAKVGATTGFIDVGSLADGFTATASTPQRRIVGGSVEARLPYHLSIELDVLYRRLNYQDYQFYSLGQTTEKVTSGALEFPALLKYRIALVGISNSWVTMPTPRVVDGQTTSGTNSSPMTLQNNVVAGISAGGGLDIRAGVVHFLPEIRYTRWISPHFGSSDQNQVEILVGIGL
jgi:hypothetical protein